MLTEENDSDVQWSYPNSIFLLPYSTSSIIVLQLVITEISSILWVMQFEKVFGTHNNSELSEIKYRFNDNYTLQYFTKVG